MIEASCIHKRAFSGFLAAGFICHVAPALAQFRERGEYDEPQRNSAPVGRDEARTQRAPGQRADWLLSLDAVTHAPVDIGAQVSAETPFRLRFSTGFGFIPGAYLGLVNSAVSAMGAYDNRTAGIVDGSFDGGTVWRAQVGFRPFPRAGFYFDAGYALVNLSGSVYGSDVSAPDVVIDGTVVRNAGYSVHTTIHMWLLEVGWHAQLLDRMTLGVGLGVMGTLSSNTEATANFKQGRSVVARSLSQDAAETVDSSLERYGYVPTLTVRVGYDFL